jgi:uncharacterized protein YjgD (DUF1641 family)
MVFRCFNGDIKKCLDLLSYLNNFGFLDEKGNVRQRTELSDASGLLLSQDCTNAIVHDVRLFLPGDLL